MNPASYLHVFFDLDKTLTASRSLMLPEHQALFKQLCAARDVVVVTGGGEAQIQAQIPPTLRPGYFMLSQQGNHAEDKKGKLLWQESVTPEQERVTREVNDVLMRDLGVIVTDPKEFFENRGSMLASSPVGFHADQAKKYAYDPDASKRLALLKRNPKELAKLDAAGIEAMPAGTTTIDYILKGKDKGANITRFIAHMGWQAGDCIYVGDALFPGGNDESVVGVIDTYPIETPEETFAFVQKVLE
ncbi:MAG: HAD-IIB family hydrolase [Patescibacteria group bacterium]